jgi:hypothetical protein
VPGPVSFFALNGAHYLRPQVSSHCPRRYVFFDTEAHRRPHRGGEEQTWRLAVSGVVKWLEQTKRWSPVNLARHETPEDLWERITGYARKDARTVVVAHNLGYDLRISRCFDLLRAMGWVIDKPYMARESVSFEARKEGKLLTFVDSTTVLPASVRVIAGWLALDYVDLPDEQADESTWWERAEQDVSVLCRAYMVAVEWLRDGDLGGWARTGSGMGWHTLLRHHLKHKVLVHGRDDLRELERQAMYSGRAEAWRWGHQAQGPYTEWDYSTAYGRVCATTPLPAIYQARLRKASLPVLRARSEGNAFLVKARVSQEVPVLPWHDDLGVCWPTGTFEGWYWLPELVLAEQEGAGIQVLEAHQYSAVPWLAEWAVWAMSQVDPDSTGDDRVRTMLAKHWLRAVVGRTAMRVMDWTETDGPLANGPAYMTMLDLTTHATGTSLTLGERRWESWSMGWHEQALPQVLSYVMSVCRIRLWEAMRAAGLENVIYCDTDSVVTTPAGTDRLAEAVADGYCSGLRIKGTHKWMSPWAPQVVEGSTFRRLAGIPRNATYIGDGRYQADVWQSLTRALSTGKPNAVQVRPTIFALAGIDTRRQHLPRGRTEPFTVQGNVRLAPGEATG